MTAHPPEASRSRRLAVLVVLGGLSAFGPLSIDLYLPALPQLTRDLDSTAGQVQLTLTGCLVGLALGQAFAGPLSDTLGRRRPLLVSLVVYAAASLLCALAPSVQVLTGLRVLQGFAGAAGIVIARAVVRDLRSGRDLARMFALVMMVNGLAPILAPVIGAQVLQFASWRVLFVVLAVLGAVLLAGVVAWLPESLPEERRRPGSIPATLRAFVSLARDRRFAGYMLTFGFGFGAMFAYISASPFVLEEVHHLSPQQFSLVFGGNALGLVVFSQLSGVLVERIGPARLLEAGVVLQSVAAIAVLALVRHGPLWAILAALFVAVAAMGLILPNASALALADHGAQAGTASALMGTFQFLVGGSTPLLMGLGPMGQDLGMGVVMAVLAVAGLLACNSLARGYAESESPVP